MSFFNRLSFFIVGILLGICILIFSLTFREKNISFNYFPNSRIKNHLIENQIFFSKKSLCKIDCHNLDTMFLDSYIRDSYINFKKSQIRGYDTKEYHLKNKNGYLIFEMSSDSIKLVDIYLDLDASLNDEISSTIQNSCDGCN